MKKTATMTMMLVLASGLCACGAASDQTTVQQTDAKEEGETVVLHILENDTAKSEGYLMRCCQLFMKHMQIREYRQ